MLRAGKPPPIVTLLLPILVALLLVLQQTDPLFPLVTSAILINEVDSETPGTDKAEFVELYDGGGGSTSLDGHVLVFYNGQDDTSYHTFDLAGYQTDANGYFLLANEFLTSADITFPDNVLQNGPDAVALYLGQGDDFPNGTAVTTTNLLDALVYGDEPDDPGLLTLLQSGQPQVDEDALTLASFHSNQRCPDGGGGGRRTAGFIQALPSPKSANNCPTSGDSAPQVSEVSPTPDAKGIAPDSSIIITFSEAVTVTDAWYTIDCTISGPNNAFVSGGSTTFTLDPSTSFAFGDTCTIILNAAQIADLDTQDPPDQMEEDYSWSFTIANPATATHVIINELDADTPGSDKAEFIELFDGGAGSTSLTGLIVVLYNGSGDSSYRALDLDGYATNAQGYFLIGNTELNDVGLVIPNSSLQNGADAAAIFEGSQADFPNGTAVTTTNLLDALVYGTDDPVDAGLLPLLQAGQSQIDESSRDNATLESSQRCPNGSGGQRNSAAYLQNHPTPGASNKCTYDQPPKVVETFPTPNQAEVATNISLTIKFSEAVSVNAMSFQLTCTTSGTHNLTVAGGPKRFTISPDTGFASGENCTTKVIATEVSDLDTDDPPDQMDNDYSWSFTVKMLSLADHMLINEVDADTPGQDRAEFIELYDGGAGQTSLDGLSIVLFNGESDTSYRTIDLDGHKTDQSGYFILGGSAVSEADLLLPDSFIQNGADAVALYAANPTDFPNGSPITTSSLLDALVYDTADDDDPGLLPLLNAGQSQVDEASLGNQENHASQRCPNGSGGQRNSSTYRQNHPTPGSINDCAGDTPPQVLETNPVDGQFDLPIDTNISISFDEDVQVIGDWFTITCSQSLSHPAATTGGPRTFTLDPQFDFAAGEQCQVTISASQIADLDGLPQHMIADYTWSFATALSDPEVPPPKLKIFLPFVQALAAP